MGNDETNGSSDPRNENFRRIATRRVNNALRQIALIEQMSASGNYKYTAEEVEVAFKTIEAAVERARQRFVLSLTRKKPAKAGESFTFGS